MKTLKMPMLAISSETEEIPVNMMSPSKVPDPGWRYVDKKGHGHFWAEGATGKLPTLEWVVTGKQWVGDEYDGEEYDVGEYRCRLCGETIEPGKKVSYAPSHVPGLTWFTIEIGNEEFRLSEDQFADALHQFAGVLREVS